jgi:hypothetical protein
VINGPASLNYDIDLGVMPVNDYYYRTADDLVEFNKFNGPPPSDNVLFNGTNVHPVTGEGAYSVTTLTPGKRHRLRIVNPSAENHFILSLANHDMTIIAVDFIPVQAQTVQSLFVSIGQRFDVTIDASKAVDNYWFNATFVTTGACGTSVNTKPAAIFRYQGAPARNPTNPGTVATMDRCEDILNLTPVVRRNVNVNFNANASNTLGVSLDLTDPNQLFTWKINNSAINVDWAKPVDEYVMTNTENQMPRSENIVRVDVRDQWTFWLVQNDPTFPIPVSCPEFLNISLPPRHSFTCGSLPKTNKHNLAAPLPSARARLPRPRPRRRAVQRGDGAAERQQPGAPRHDDAAVAGLARHRLQDGQPGRLADALPHRVARLAGPVGRLPRARRRPQDAVRRPADRRRQLQRQLRRLARLLRHLAQQEARLGPVSEGTR